MTSPWETTAGMVLVVGGLMGLAWLLTVGLAQGARRAAAEHDRRMARVRAVFPPVEQVSNVIPLVRDTQHVVVVPANRLPHSRAR